MGAESAQYQLAKLGWNKEAHPDGGQNQTFKLGDTEFNSPYSAAVSHQLSRQQRLQEMSFKKKKITGQVEHGERTGRVPPLSGRRAAPPPPPSFVRAEST